MLYRISGKAVDGSLSIAKANAVKLTTIRYRCYAMRRPPMIMGCQNEQLGDEDEQHNRPRVE